MGFLKVVIFFFTFLIGMQVEAQVRISGKWAVETPVDNIPVLNIFSACKGFRTEAIDSHSFVFSVSNLPCVVYFEAEGYEKQKVHIRISDTMGLNIVLQQDVELIKEVSITGNIMETQKSASPVIVEVIKGAYLKKNNSPTLFENLGLVTGVRPQINCSVCNAGDIHINGMEGPYTMVLIDGLPIMSSLGSVYGLVGIPTSIVERIEVIKGPAASLYGSESMGGTVNIITRKADAERKGFAEYMWSSWNEHNVDVALSRRKKQFSILSSANIFNYNGKHDLNKDQFTDIAQQFRTSIFTKVSGNNQRWDVAGRLVWENRWGGDIRWKREFGGTDSIYGESINTRRVEIMGKQLLLKNKDLVLQYAGNYHQQQSFYGQNKFDANQIVAFAQVYKIIEINKNNKFMAGSAYKYMYYDDNTAATVPHIDKGKKDFHTHLPGVFMQNEITVNKLSLLLGYRADWHQNHGIIQSPRFAGKWQLSHQQSLRINAGKGFRIVNLFTEDHAALTGSRTVVIEEALEPEKSKNITLNYAWEVNKKNGFVKADVSLFYTHFSNQIIGDYTTNQDQIIFKNLNGFARAQGGSFNMSVYLKGSCKLSAGVAYTQSIYKQDSVTRLQLFAPKWSGNGTFSYTFKESLVKIDATAQWNGPMRLPTLAQDFRPEYSPWHCIANVQATKTFSQRLEVFVGIKNLFNFVPKHPIMRPQDPFDKQAGDTVNNPMGYTFDASYNYASLQGIRMTAGIKIGF